MIPVVMLKAVEPIATPRPFAGSRDHALRLLPQFDPGDVLSARVQAKLPDGTFKVLVEGQALRMALPAHLGPGDALELAFAAREPRLTFVLKDMLPAQSMPLPQLSAAGRLVATTMLQTGEIALPLGASALAPLLSLPPADGARLSGALAQALAESGLFYEAHQAQWAAGTRELAQVLREPQARLTQTASARASGVDSAAASTGAGVTPAAAGSLGQEPCIDARTVHLVQQQLAALDGAKCALQLQIWPGQWMQWEIDDEQPGAAREAQQTRTWSTQLQLELPRLGRLLATLALHEDDLRIRLQADSADLLRQHRGGLLEALAAAGVPAADIAIARHEQA